MLQEKVAGYRLDSSGPGERDRVHRRGLAFTVIKFGGHKE
jgi:hypothetical protein